MGFHSRQMILHVLVLWICAVLSTDAQNNQVAKPGCQSRCGNFSISYPFGIGKQGCYRDEGFEILCKSSEADKSIEAPFLGISDIEIVEISLLDLVRVRGPVTSNCYSNISLEEGRGRGRFNKMFNLSASPFTISDSHNKLFAVGCDVFSYISDPTIEQYISGCASLCPNNSDHHVDLLNGSCFGIGCCQTTIPKGFKMINLSVDSINRRTQLAGDSDFNRCSFAALLDYDPNNLNSNASSLVKALNHTIRTSTVTLDWAIGNTSCQNLSTGDECGSNSNCEDSITGFGYHCRCLQGFEGNPYLGCQDIDECKLDKCPKGAQCFNSEGGYECKRPPGYLPDTSEACFPDNRKSYSKYSKMEVALSGIGIAVGTLVLLAVGFWLFKKLSKRKQIKLKEKYYKKNGGLLLEQQVSSGEGTVEKTKIFVQEELEKATDNFNKSRILGKGGSGTVYKGMLTDGRIVAIKKSKIVDESQTGDFINELVILSQINHRNVVKLLGCCLETEVPLLVYEYISNGTLSQHLHENTLKSSISWEHRLRISIELAGALSYLHSSASTPIFHRDIKSSNILLDECYKATVFDFGISRSVPIEATHLTTLVQGTFGYLDPEYFHSGQFTDKSDVYSFGIVLVELLTGQKPISFSRSEQETNLAMHFISSVKQDRLHEILETRVLNEAGKEEIFVIAKLAKRCLKLVGKKRPTMKQVMVELEGLRRHDREQSLVIQKNYQPSMNLVNEQSSITMTWPYPR